jgi:hypothetical protein
MSISKRFFPVIVLLFFLCACNPGKAATPTPDIWEISIDPALVWLLPEMNKCIQPYSNKILSVSETENLNKTPINIEWGEGSIDSAQVYQIGEDQPVLILHNQNSIRQISYASAQAIIKGIVRTWKEVDPASESLGDIHIWNYPTQSGLMRKFNSWFNGSSFLATSYNIAPDPAAMLQAVSSDPAAFGWLPNKWIKNQVKPIGIADLPMDKKPIPILLYINKNPGEIESDWVRCMQNSNNKAP